MRAVPEQPCGEGLGQLEQILPRYDFSHRHRLVIPAPGEQVWRAVYCYRLDESRVIRWLFRLRGLPRPGTLQATFSRMGFRMLAEKPDELVMGSVVRLRRGAKPVEPVTIDGRPDFETLNQARCLKLAFNLAAESLSADSTLLRTETRVRCTDAAARRIFVIYWTAIRPFSGLIRRRWLHGIRNLSLARQASDDYGFRPPPRDRAR